MKSEKGRWKYVVALVETCEHELETLELICKVKKKSLFKANKQTKNTDLGWLSLETEPRKPLDTGAVGT